MRETHEWTEQELEFLSLHYALRGSAFIRAKYPHLTSNGVRQQATRLCLAEDLLEYTPLADVAEEAGVTPRAIHNWLSTRPWARKHCRTFGPDTLLPLPVIRLYHPETRRARPPRGWPTAQQAAPRLKTSERDITRRCQDGRLSCVIVRGAWFVNPDSLPSPHRLAPPAGYVHLPTVAREASVSRKTLSTLPTVAVKGSRGRPAHYASPHHVRAFLTARAHHAEQVETIIRRAQAIDASRTKDVRSDTEGK